MSKKQNKKFITPEILRGAVKGAFVKLNPRYMMRNPVMFVVEIGCFITLLLSFFPGLFGDVDAGSLRIYDIIVCVILFITVLFANFAEAVAEGRGKAQAASLKKTQKDTEAHLLHEDGSETIVRSSELKKGDIVLVVAGEVIPGDGEVIEGIASVDESAITGESAPVVRESGGDFCSVTGGTTLVSDWLKIRITSEPGNSFLDRMIALVEGASPQKDPQRDRTEHPAGVPDHHLPDRGGDHVSLRRIQRRTDPRLHPDRPAGLLDPHHHRRPAVRHRHRGHGPCHPLQRHCHERQGSGGLRRRGYHDPG